MLVRALAEPTHRDVLQEVALASLAELDAPETFDLAVRYARWGAPANSREDSLKALAQWATARRDPKTTERVRKVLEGYLTDPVYLVRDGAFDALGELGDPAAIPALERAARNEADDEQRLNAEEAIRTIGEKQAAERAATRDLEQRVIQLEREVEVLKAKPSPPSPLPPTHTPSPGEGRHHPPTSINQR
ncbi:MAG TPA: HEAT repeat domain-containing protein [Thermoanaerobaculia bacterium]|nr:HEAT repeat domain-containing protein [Thermoanaerobaculia bacterium]